MQAPINHEHLQKKWAPLLDYDGLEPIKDNHKRMVTAQLLENQETAIREEREFLSEAVPTNSTGSNGNTSSGFGGLACAIAEKTGARVDGITLSKVQIDFSKKIAREKKLDNLCQFRIEDYRDTKKK